MGTAAAIATGATCVWLGMVLAISFLETPLKFRAPGVTVPIGLGIGRLVFRALNLVELLLAAAVVAALLAGTDGDDAAIPLGIAIAALAAQVLLVRPALSRRSDAVLAGKDAPRSHAHWFYVGLEVVKVAALATAAVVLLTAGS